MRRVLSIHFPHFAMDRHGLAARRQARYAPPVPGGSPDEETDDGKPLVLVEHGTRGTRITAANEAAYAAGSAIGQKLTDARAACPTLKVEPADPEADADALLRLGQWAIRYSPTVALCEPDGLLIDITGCAHLFGGEARLVADILTRLQTIGFTAWAGLAPTPGAADALARFGEGAPIVAETALWPALDPLPVEALRLTQDRVLLLRRLGLKTVGAVRIIPRPALERRFRSRETADRVQLRLDQMAGRVREPLAPLSLPVPHRAVLPCPEPALDITAIDFALETLLPRLCHRLERDGRGARRFRLTACRCDGDASAVSVGLSQPARDAARIRRLFADRLERIDPGFGIDAFVLTAHDLEPLATPQASLISGDGAGGVAMADAMADLADRLINRLGAGAVSLLHPVPSHVPERAQHAVAIGVRDTAGALTWDDWRAAMPATAERPVRLFERPEAVTVMAEVPDGPPLNFTWRRVRRQVIRARGPERIAPEWWREDAQGAPLRDYFDVEDTQGRRYWLFRAGTFGDASADPPRRTPHWYVHGLFA